jgi:hypothetical protein
MTKAWGGARCVLLLLWAAFVLVPAAGCGGSDRAHVSGTLVHKDGTPLVRARVLARSRETGHSASGVTNEQGFFELGVEKKGDGIPPGEYYVVIYEDRGDADYPNPPSISSKYEKASGSGFTLKVKAGERNTFDATLDPP